MTLKEALEAAQFSYIMELAADNEGMSLKEMSEIADCSPSHLGKLFKQYGLVREVETRYVLSVADPD